MDAVNRRHLSKGARAYLAVLMHPEIAAVKVGRPDKSRSECAINSEELAKTAGVSPRLVDDAIAIYRQFAARADVRASFEDGIWVGRALDKILSGIKGFLATGQDPDEEEETEEAKKSRLAVERVETALQKWVGITTAFKQWETLTPDGKSTVTQAGVDTVLALPAYVKLSISEALRKESEA